MNIGASSGAAGHPMDNPAASVGLTRRANAVQWEATQLVSERRGPRYAIDVARSRFPYCITWTPLPGITALLPFIGHMGITDSRGVVYDFAGPYSIGIDDMAFGRPVRYIQCDPELITRGRAAGVTPQEAWDAAIDGGADVYSCRMHNICCDNCHSHVALCLNTMGYAGRANWGMVSLAVWTLVGGKYVSWGRALWQWGPFTLLVTAILLLRFLTAK